MTANYCSVIVQVECSDVAHGHMDHAVASQQNACAGQLILLRKEKRESIEQNAGMSAWVHGPMSA